MQIPVLIETVDNIGYRATIGQPLVMSAEGTTREEALDHLREAVKDRLKAGAEIASLELPNSEHPLARFAGMLKDEPLFEAWQQAIADYRKQRDEEEEDM